MATPARSAATAATLRAASVEKRFGERVALRGVSFEVAPGELVAVIGPNGAGKTTLLSILAGIQRPTPEASSCRPGRSAGCPQQPAVYSKLSVAENLRLFARLERVEDPDGGRRADARAGRTSPTAPTTRWPSSRAATASA